MILGATTWADLLALQPDWNSYGARAINPMAIVAIRNVVEGILQELPGAGTGLLVVPLVDGRVRLCWQHPTSFAGPDRQLPFGVRVLYIEVIVEFTEGSPGWIPLEDHTYTVSFTVGRGADEDSFGREHDFELQGVGLDGAVSLVVPLLPVLHQPTFAF